MKVDITLCAPDSHVPRAENAIRFVKERLRAIQCETPFTRYPKRFTIEMVKRVVVLINSFRRNSGVNPVMSPRQILFGKKFKTLLCKIGELVMAYDVTSSNDTTKPRAFYALYIGPNDGGTGHKVFKLGTKKMITTPKCKPVPMPDDVIKVVNDMGRQERMPDGIQFHNIHHESTLSDLYADEDNSDCESSCASDKDYSEKKKPEVDLQKVPYDNDLDDDEVVQIIVVWYRLQVYFRFLLLRIILVGGAPAFTVRIVFFSV